MSCLASSLCRLPPELFENILEYLGDNEINWLRLTCKDVRDRTLHRFRRRFIYRQTDLSANSLQMLIDIGNHEQFGSAVETVTVVAVLYDSAYLHELVKCTTPFPESSDNPTEPPDRPTELTGSEVSQVRWELSLLSKLEAEQHGPKVQDVRTGHGLGRRPIGRVDVVEEEEKTRLSRTMLTIAFCQLGRLKSLILEAAVYKMAAVRLAAYKCTDTEVMWRKASYVFREVMIALAESRMIVDRLSIYGGPWGGSVSCDIIHEVVGFWTDQDREKTLDAVKRLSLCVSAWNPDEATDYRAERKAAPTVNRHRSLAGFLALCPNVEELELQGYATDRGGIPWSQDCFESVAEEVQFSSLRSCALGGLHLREIDLIRFLEDNRRLGDLSLQVVTLTQGDWHAVFRFCLDKLVELEMLTFQYLWVSRHVFLIENEDENGVVRISGEDLKRIIGVCGTAKRGLRRKRRLYEKYGPPGCVPNRLQFDGIGRGSLLRIHHPPDV